MQRAVVACADPWMQEWLAAQLCRASLAVQLVNDAASLRKLLDADRPALVVGEPSMLPVQMPGPTHWLVLGVEGGLIMPPTAADVSAELAKRGFASVGLRMSPFALQPPPPDKTPPRRAPPPPLPDVLPLAASLKQVPWPRLLCELHMGTFTGLLKVVRGDAERRVLWLRGQIVAVHEASGDTTLAQAAKDGGWPPESTLQASSYLEAHPGQVAAALFDTRLMSLAEVCATLSTHYRKLLVEAFGWVEGGSYKIEAEPLVNSLGLEGVVNVWPLLTQSVEKAFKLNELMDAMAPVASQYIVPTPRFARVVQNFQPYLPQLTSHRLLTGEVTFQGALTAAEPNHATQLAQELFTVWSCQMVKASKEAQKVAMPVSAAPPPPAPTAAVDYRELSHVISAIAQAHAKVGKVDHFALLGVAPDAKAQAIEEAFTARLREMQLNQLPPGLGDDVVKRAGQLLLALKTARFTLVDPAARQRYVASLKKAT